MKIRENVKISTLTTMKIGGKARYVIDVESPDDLQDAYEFAYERELPVYVLGSGANTIGKDEGFDGVILVNKICTPASPKKLDKFERKDKTAEEYLVEVGGGVNWNDFVCEMSEQGFTGLECLAAIPGTVGAAPVQNIGAYGQDVSQSLEYVLVYDSWRHKDEFNGEKYGYEAVLAMQKEKAKDAARGFQYVQRGFIVIPASAAKFAYRSSIFNHGDQVGRFFIVYAAFRLKKGSLKPPFYNSLQAYLDEHKIIDYSPKNLAKAVTAVRNSKLPDPAKVASSGSFFKNILLNDAEADEAEKKGIPVRRAEVSKSDKPLSKSQKKRLEKMSEAEREEFLNPRVHKVNTAWLIEKRWP